MVTGRDNIVWKISLGFLKDLNATIPENGGACKPENTCMEKENMYPYYPNYKTSKIRENVEGE